MGGGGAREGGDGSSPSCWVFCSVRDHPVSDTVSPTLRSKWGPSFFCSVLMKDHTDADCSDRASAEEDEKRLVDQGLFAFESAPSAPGCKFRNSHMRSCEPSHMSGGRRGSGEGADASFLLFLRCTSFCAGWPVVTAACLSSPCPGYYSRALHGGRHPAAPNDHHRPFFVGISISNQVRMAQTPRADCWKTPEEEGEKREARSLVSDQVL